MLPRATYCERCVNPQISAVPTNIDRDGICGSCQNADEESRVDWSNRRRELEQLVDPYRGRGDYDIVIPVSGGKDSYFQTHYAIEELGLKPLLVTYHGNNYLPEGERNLERMRTAFGCDHVIVRPSVDALIKMNRIGFFLQGDMNWHAHCGIFTVPIRTAVQFRVPLMLWGEHGFSNIGGMYRPGDLIEFTKRDRLEHALRGFDWHDFTNDGLDRRGRSELKEGLTARDLSWAIYPSDAEIDSVGVRGIYLGNFVPWSGTGNADVAVRYGWEAASKPFERTYRQISNLDDRYENGAHDYLKFIKFGYGRGTDHAGKDARLGLLTREEAVEMVLKYDHVRPSDISHWCEYVDISESRFNSHLDSLRDPRVWWREGGEWKKWCIDGRIRSYDDGIVKTYEAD